LHANGKSNNETIGALVNKTNTASLCNAFCKTLYLATYNERNDKLSQLFPDMATFTSTFT
jgi:hypothetical protein